MGSVALFGPCFNNFFATHKGVSPTNAKSMFFLNIYTKNGQCINDPREHFCSISTQIVSRLGLIFLFFYINYHFRYSIVGIYYE